MWPHVCPCPSQGWQNLLVNASAGDRRRLARAVLRLHQYDTSVHDQLVRARLDELFFVGKSLDFVARLREFGDGLTPELAMNFAELAGIGRSDLRLRVLPILKRASVVDFSVDAQGTLTHIEEYVGVSAPLWDQVLAVLDQIGLTDLDWAVLTSIELASSAPLTRSDHLEQLANRGYLDRVAAQALSLCLAAQINAAIPSRDLAEDVVFSPHVWASEAVDVATFLHSLPSEERTALLSVCGDAIARPGLTLSTVSANPRMVTAARRVGLLQAATVKSTTQQSQTYLFSPMLDREFDGQRSTEVLHERKLFVAHILFGHERAMTTGGRIISPVVLVDALLQKGRVGPATNIGTDYHLLEAAGIIRVEPVNGRANLHMVKREIVSDGLELLRRLGGEEAGEFDPSVLSALRPPRTFEAPEHDRLRLSADAASEEITRSAILKLREDAGRAARHEKP